MFSLGTRGVSKKILVTVGVIIVLFVVLLFSMNSQEIKNEPKSVSLNQEFELHKGEEAIFNGIHLAFEGYETKPGRGGIEGVVAKFKASLAGVGTSLLEVEEIRGIGWDVLIEKRVGTWDNTDPSKEEYHIFTLQFIKKVSDDSIRISILDFYTLHGREAYEKWYKEAFLDHPEQ